ncbi:hypothetical protein SAMN02745150_00960 [Brevinema andersonii]|uniref:Uncharacterized protein n=1 Tax=Brevinema andersonii TaxID=34097 RepID=A0A1I1E523_BREAD|nr:hypothetical protein SAMN02745150_00960 [Brevinema andersonii]
MGLKKKLIQAKHQFSIKKNSLEHKGLRYKLVYFRKMDTNYQNQ